MIHIHQALSDFRSHYQNIFLYIGGLSFSVFFRSILYGVFAVIIAQQFGSQTAGVIVSMLALVQLLVWDPLSGWLVDRIGARNTARIGMWVLLLSTIIIYFVWVSQYTLTFLGISMGIATSFSRAEAYLIRISKADEWGKSFGIAGDLICTAYFLSTILMSTFMQEDKYNWVFLGVIFGQLVFLVLTFFVEDDRSTVELDQRPWREIINPLLIIKHGIHFVKTNNNYPLLSLGTSLFIGLFYGAIWFIFPLYFAENTGDWWQGLQLGIYDLVGMFFAAYAGYLADKYHWKYLHVGAWSIVLFGLMLLPLYPVTTALILVGFIIALGRHLVYAVAQNVLEKHDVDHKEDGAFVALGSMVMNIGYVLAPLACGYLYGQYGFEMTLWFVSISCGWVALYMILQTYFLDKHEI